MKYQPITITPPQPKIVAYHFDGSEENVKFLQGVLNNPNIMGGTMDLFIVWSYVDELHVICNKINLKWHTLFEDSYLLLTYKDPGAPSITVKFKQELIEEYGITGI